MREWCRGALLIVSLALIAAAQAATVWPEAATRLLREQLGSAIANWSCFWLQRYPCPIGSAILAVVTGGALAALAVRPAGSEEAAPASAAGLASRRLITLARFWIGMSTASLLAVVAIVGDGSLVVATWLAAVFLPFLCLVALDRERAAQAGTRVGNTAAVRRGWVVLVALVAAQLVYVTHDLTHWRWSGTPDEAQFFAVAKTIAQGKLGRSLVSTHGVFDYHPVLSSQYQAWFLALLGENGFAWRLSSAVALSLALPSVYVLGRELWDARTGLIAAALLGFAQLATTFGHFGYNNTQVYPLVLGSLAAFAWSVRRASLTGYYLAGVLAGFGFFTFYPARLTPLLLFLLAVQLGGTSLLRRDGRKLMLCAFGFLVTALPILANPDEMIRQLLRQTSIGSGVAASGFEMDRLLAKLTAGANIPRLLEHWALAAAHVFWAKPDHFLSNLFVDRLTGAFAAIGLWLGILARRGSPDRTPAAAYLLIALLAGATSPYEWPPNTRLMCLAPFTALLAAVGMARVCDRLASHAGRPLAHLAAGVLVAAAVAANGYAQYRSVYRQYRGYGSGKTAELVRLAKRLPEHSALVHVEDDVRSMEGLDRVLDQYGMASRLIYLSGVRSRVSHKRVHELRPPFVVFQNLQDPEAIRALETDLAARFPDHQWTDSDPGKSWNLRYLHVPVAPAP